MTMASDRDTPHQHEWFAFPSGDRCVRCDKRRDSRDTDLAMLAKMPIAERHFPLPHRKGETDCCAWDREDWPCDAAILLRAPLDADTENPLRDKVAAMIHRPNEPAWEGWNDAITAVLGLIVDASERRDADTENAGALRDLIRELAETVHQTGSLRDHADPNDKTGWNVHAIETCDDGLCRDALAAIDRLAASPSPLRATTEPES